MLRIATLLLLFLATTAASAQVRLNEAVNSNGQYEDEDGDTPDWFELRNTGPALNLAGWTVTDDEDEPGKWAFPNILLGTDEHLLVWASGKDRPAPPTYRTLVADGDECRYVVPTSDVSTDWVNTDYDDSAWTRGRTSIGYGDGDYATQLNAGTLSVFVRQTFTVADPATIEELILNVDYDDGFVAYLNGTEIARANMVGTRPGYDEEATQVYERRMNNGGTPNAFPVAFPAGRLRSGENVLAIQVHNTQPGSSDLTLSAFLTARYNQPSLEGQRPPTILGYDLRGPHTNFKLSAGGENLYLFNPAGERVDRLKVEGIERDQSTGIPPTGGEARTYERTTPGAANLTPGYVGEVNGTVNFNRESGLHAPFSLELTADGSGDIHYTTDASEPTKDSPRYTGPLDLTETTVVRARLFDGEKFPSELVTRTYLINPGHDLDVVSIVVDPQAFFNPVTGLYAQGFDAEPNRPYFGANYWRDDELDASFSFFPADDGEQFSQDVGLQIFGAYSRSFDQRSLSIHARNRYGCNEMDYPFFTDRPYDTYKSLVLRSSGHDWRVSKIRDATMTGLMDGSGVDVQAYRPVVTYINGQYWGIYNLREKVNEDFLASRHGVNPDSVDILESTGNVVEGSNTDYRALFGFVRDNDLQEEDNFARVEREIDVDNYIKYNVAEIYYANRDWPVNNIKFWRAQRPGAKWRWILFDTDFGLDFFGTVPHTVNGFEFALDPAGPSVWPNPPISTLFLRRCMENEGFRHRFINQFADELNSRFLFSNVDSLLSANEDRIASEMPRNFARWNLPDEFSVRVDQMRGFLRERPAAVKGHVLDFFRLPAYHQVGILLDDEQEGYVQLNSLSITECEWSGDYFEEVPIRLTAIPREGYVFSHWELGSESMDAEITVDVKEAMEFKPIFREVSTAIPGRSGLGSLANVSQIQYAPNPGSATAWVRLQSKCGTQVTVELFDARGVRVRTIAANALVTDERSFTTDLSALPAGTYQLRVLEAGGGTVAYPWVIR
ncbi:CotH kinase family protein [Lewinella sp. 4G2]|uniref:CotH kinase family protein n=1 Tax=Lewinella sp. 4G2 TaxID=1803372 RepID=UPI0007B469F6|nr:CotH kinase family protein [Lewinella sp. 4G2]OAV43527.1 hypothetical protein A3850_003020 [Lewinella sp. 4G2]